MEKKLIALKHLISHFWRLCKQCQLCQKAGPLRHGLCLSCYQALTFLSGDSRQNDPIDQSAHALPLHGVFDYSGLVRELIVKLKYHQAFWVVPIVGSAMAEKAPHWMQGPGVIVPMPMYHRKRLQRGYNQAALIAHWVAKCLNMPVNNGLLWRMHDTVSQQSLGKKEREKNALGSMCARKGEEASIIIIDDVVTTGASMRAAQQALQEAGYEQITMWSVALTSS